MTDSNPQSFSLNDIQVFIISMGSHPQNSSLIDQLKSQGLSPQLIRAVDGRHWTLPFDLEIVNTERFKKVIGRQPTGPEIGCAMSHIVCATQAQSAGARYAIVLEEDANIEASLLPAIKFLRELDPDNPSVLQLFSLSKPLFRKASIVEVDSTPPAVIGRFFLPPSSTVAYALNRSAIEAFASRPTIEGVADWPPYANAFNFWGFYPWPVSHIGDHSTIEPHRLLFRNQSRTENRFWKFFIEQLRLFGLNRVREHSQSLGSLRAYFKYVILPQSGFTLRRIMNVLGLDHIQRS